MLFGRGPRAGTVLCFDDLKEKGYAVSTVEARWSLPWDVVNVAIYVPDCGADEKSRPPEVYMHRRQEEAQRNLSLIATAVL